MKANPPRLASSAGRAGMVVSWQRKQLYSSWLVVSAGRRVVSDAAALSSRKWQRARKRGIITAMNA
jgi:hypothetical protein